MALTLSSRARQSSRQKRQQQRRRRSWRNQRFVSLGVVRGGNPQRRGQTTAAAAATACSKGHCMQQPQCWADKLCDAYTHSIMHSPWEACETVRAASAVGGRTAAAAVSENCRAKSCSPFYPTLSHSCCVCMSNMRTTHLVCLHTHPIQHRALAA